ncbi:MAG: squalene/phytoene synthase family protein, partial [Nitrospinaceae bacterium]|nr:squalene/phytoene synthase family protein [Nitrospinaceae bacterium]NIR55626.1 squalene/phytoene synthase family protein [Nitrospinaceae bacterium]NIS86060.1 squalene/phytoene synthase family protein [Nitrospinaceae bacterium]NIT82903.1 squalene/phytoene synthase family protein [Nitrospinaceae bacterium]NIU45108.1 squalene/phytoene synthase family protein [Nitrospinaceae bacterium]
MDDWTYCVNTLPKVSRTFALNISVLRGELYRSVLTAYLFCRTIDTIEDAAHLEGSAKARLLRDFSKLLEEAGPRETALEAWLQRCEGVDGSPNDLDLLKNIPRVFRVFDGLKPDHRNSIIPSVSRMAKGMAYFQGRARTGMLVPLENENELEEYC